LLSLETNGRRQRGQRRRILSAVGYVAHRDHAEPEDGLEPTTYRLQGNTPQRSDTTIWLQIGRFGDSMPTVELRADASR
jgi:hypothetical protein